MKKGIGVGIEDFKKIIEEDCYYFDKTNYIEELLKDRTEIKLFKDLYIEKSEYFKEQGQYPVYFYYNERFEEKYLGTNVFCCKSINFKSI